MAEMMFDNDYDNYGSSQFSGTQIGGGFINNENFDSSNNQRNKPSMQKNSIPYQERKLSQITIKQIQTAPPPQPDENLIIDGQEISQISLIAQIQEINVQTSGITLTVNDGTGSIKVKQWANEKESLPQTADFVQGQYIRIIGRITHYNGRCTVNSYTIFPITNCNEISHHFLECIYAHLENTIGGNSKRNNSQSKQMAFMSNQNNMNNMNNNNQMNDYNMSQNQMRSAMNNNNMNGNFPEEMNMSQMNANQMNANQMNMNLNPIQNMVLNIMKDPRWDATDTGCDVEYVFNQLPDKNVDSIREAVDELSNAGFIYSTVDDDHYKFSGNLDQ